jgi:hypothetical protein
MSDATAPAGSVERRRNPELRALIDEMLERVREIHRNSSVWEPNERAQAEAALEQIMSRVRRGVTIAPEEEFRSGPAAGETS